MATAGNQPTDLILDVCVLPIPERADRQRLDFLDQAMELANRPDEIELIIDRAKAIRAVETLRFLSPHWLQ